MPSKDVRGIQFNRLNLPVTDFQHFTVVAEIEPIVLNQIHWLFGNWWCHLQGTWCCQITKTCDRCFKKCIWPVIKVFELMLWCCKLFCYSITQNCYYWFLHWVVIKLFDFANRVQAWSNNTIINNLWLNTSEFIWNCYDVAQSRTGSIQ